MWSVMFALLRLSKAFVDYSITEVFKEGEGVRRRIISKIT